MLFLPFRYLAENRKLAPKLRNWGTLKYSAKNKDLTKNTVLNPSKTTIDFHRNAVILRHSQKSQEIFISLKRRSVIFCNDQRFSVPIIAVSALGIVELLLCNNTDHGCFSSKQSVIFIEIHAMCINYQSWNILKNLFASLNQSEVSMIIAESSKGVNPGEKVQIFKNIKFFQHCSTKKIWQAVVKPSLRFA